MYRGFTEPLGWHFPPGRQIRQRFLPVVPAQLQAVGNKQTEKWKFAGCTEQPDAHQRDEIRKSYRVSCRCC